MRKREMSTIFVMFLIMALLIPAASADTCSFCEFINVSNITRGVTDHAFLTNLSADNHPQYILTNGTRAFTGKQSLGGFNLTDLLDPVALQDAATKNYVDLVNASQTAFTNMAISTANTSMKNYVDTANASMQAYVDAHAPITDHGLLSNLSGDGHPQYILVSGTRAFTGKQSLGGFNLTDLLDPVALQDAATKNYVDLVNASMKNYVDAHPSITDHGMLSNLTGDGHPQYILVSGTRAFTGKQSLGGFNLTDLLDPVALQDAATKNYVDLVNASQTAFTSMAISTANTSMKNYVDTANASMKTYVDNSNTSMKSYVDTANSSMKNYVDTRDAKIGVARLDTPITTTSTSATNMTGLSFYLGAGQTIQFDGYINNGNSAATGNKYALYIPAGATLVCHWEGDGTSILLRTMSRSIANGTLTTQNYHTYISQDGYTTIHGTIKNGANAGTVTLMYAAVNAANTVTINAGSYLEWKKLDSATAY